MKQWLQCVLHINLKPSTTGLEFSICSDIALEKIRQVLASLYLRMLGSIIIWESAFFFFFPDRKHCDGRNYYIVTLL